MNANASGVITKLNKHGFPIGCLARYLASVLPQGLVSLLASLHFPQDL